MVEKRETSRISWAMVTSKCEACSYNATNLIKGNEYQFRISAVNKFGVGKPLDSDPVIAQMQYSKYRQSQALIILHINQSLETLSSFAALEFCLKGNSKTFNKHIKNMTFLTYRTSFFPHQLCLMLLVPQMLHM